MFQDSPIKSVELTTQHQRNLYNPITEEDHLKSALDYLNLTAKYPEKITMQDIASVPVIKKVRSPADIPWYLLQKIIGLDYSGRNKDFYPKQEKKKASGQADTVQSLLRHITAKETVPYHPMDILNAVYLCSSPFLRPILAEKMFQCQLSLPLILPPHAKKARHNLTTWPLRGIICADETGKELSILEQPSLIFTFAKLGSGKAAGRSKSKLLNDLIHMHGTQYHNVFYHGQMEHGNAPKKISQGTVDLGWKLPGNRSSSSEEDGKPDQDIEMYLNMHGDAMAQR